MHSISLYNGKIWEISFGVNGGTCSICISMSISVPVQNQYEHHQLNIFFKPFQAFNQTKFDLRSFDFCNINRMLNPDMPNSQYPVEGSKTQNLKIKEITT